MHKYYVLDTNVLLHASNALEGFADNTVVLAMTVVEELDRFKSRNDNLGQNARAVIRHLDRLRADAAKSGLHLLDGVPNRCGGRVRVMLDRNLPPPPGLEAAGSDNLILRAAYALKHDQADPVIFVTKDVNARIKSDIAGIPSEDRRTDRVNMDELYAGFRELVLPAADIDRFHAEGGLDLPADVTLFPNEFVAATAEGNPQQSALGRADGQGRIVPLRKEWSRAYGVTGRSREQRMALQLLLDPSVRLVTMVGTAGTGKTFLALAAGLEAIRRQDEALRKGETDPAYTYDKLLVSRPIMPLGNDIGFLPGAKDDKLQHWMQPIFDNLAHLVQLAPGGRDLGKMSADRKVQELLKDGTVELEAITYIRGRSIPRQFMIVDEAQNLTPHEVKTVVSRAGEGTKVVLCGDPYQIDNPYLDSASNGLSHAAERMKESPLAGHVTLRKSERSDLAAAAAAVL